MSEAQNYNRKQFGIASKAAAAQHKKQKGHYKTLVGEHLRPTYSVCFQRRYFNLQQAKDWLAKRQLPNDDYTIDPAYICFYMGKKPAKANSLEKRGEGYIIYKYERLK